MDDITALLKHIRDRNNPSPYTPMLGRIISLPKLQIQLGSRILLYADDVQTTFDIYEKEYDSDGHFLRYKHMGKQAVSTAQDLAGQPYCAIYEFISITQL